MTRGILWMVVACLAGQCVPVRAGQGTPGQLPEVQLRTSLNRGDRIAVALFDGVQVRGTVGSRLNRGFEIEWPGKDSPRFVKYDAVRALLDPDTGEVIALTVSSADPPDKRWVTPVLIGLGAVAALTLITHGLFPLCLFERC